MVKISSKHQEQTSYENNIVAEFKKKSEPICYYCKKSVQIQPNKNNLTVDHKTPLSRGGKSVEKNLAIACFKCNQEKANMTEKEYKKFKSEQRKILNKSDAVRLTNSILELFEKVVDQAQKVNVQYIQADKDLQKLEKEIASKNHTAAGSLQLINSLKDCINQREQLKQQKDTMNTLHSIIAPMKKQIENTKIADSILQESYSNLKAACIDRSGESKVVSMPDNKTEMSG